MPRTRVFVSSVIEGFAEYRQAARSGIEQAGGEAILVNEDFPSQASSSRNTCLDAIDSCDVFLIVLGGWGGWKTPSGRLVIEEEFEHARASSRWWYFSKTPVATVQTAKHLILGYVFRRTECPWVQNWALGLRSAWSQFASRRSPATTGRGPGNRLSAV